MHGQHARARGARDLDGAGWHHGRISPDHPDLSDVLLRVRHGDHDAFATLYDALAPLVYGTILRVLRDPAMSEEVAQEVFLELWRTAPRYDPERASVNAWAVTIARRRAIDRVRREQLRRDRTAEEAAAPTPAPDTVDHAVGRLEADRVHRALAGLPEEQREAVELAFIEGCPHPEIAARLGLPLGTVKGRIRLGLRRLRGTLGEET